AAPMSTDRGEVLWAPPPDVWTTTAAGRFAARHGFGSYEDLHRWSVTDLEGFWGAVTEELGVIWRASPSRVLADGDESMPGARWFPGAELNYAEHALAHAS